MRPTLTLLLAVLLAACAGASAVYSPAAYREARTLSSRSLRLMELSVHPFEDHAGAVAKLRTDLNTAHVNAQSRERNGATAAQWDRLLSPESHLLGGFLARWEQESRLNPGLVAQAIPLVAAAFDSIQQLEIQKPGAPVERRP